MAARRIEVPQEASVPLARACLVVGLSRIGALGVDVIGDHGLGDELCVSVGVGGAEGTLFGNGNHVLEPSGISIDGGRGGIDDVCDIVLLRRAQ